MSGRRRRVLEPYEKVANQLEALHPGALEGLTRAASGTVAGGGILALSGERGGGAQTKYGCLLAASGTVTIPAGGGGILSQLTTELDRVGFPDAPLGAPWVLPHTATYWVGVDIEPTDGYRRGGPVQVTRTPTGSSLAAATTYVRSSRPWTRFDEPIVVDGNAGETLDVVIAPDDGAEHTAEVTVRIGLMEPIAAAERTPIETPLLVNDPPGTMSFASPDITVAIPAAAEVGDLLIVLAGGVHFASQPPTSIASAGWTTLVHGEPVSGSRSTTVGWRLHDGIATTVKIEGGSSSSFVLCTWAKVLVFRGAKLGTFARAFGSGTGRTLALPTPTYSKGFGRLFYGAGTDNDTGPGTSSGGTAEAAHLWGSGKSAGSASTVGRWDPAGTDEDYTFTIPQSSTYDVMVFEIVGENTPDD